jgi:hypothetical protein
MITDAIGSQVHGIAHRGDSDPILELDEVHRAAIRPILDLGEVVVWAGRGNPRPFRSVPVFPAFFAAFLCGLSGFALMAVFGILGDRRVGAAERILLLGLPPAALAGAAAVGLAGHWARHRFRENRIARSSYVLTDRRAIVGTAGWETGEITLWEWTADFFDDTRRIEHGDGIGAVYFAQGGEVIDPQWGFEGIREAGRVESMIREVLLGEKPPAEQDLPEF